LKNASYYHEGDVSILYPANHDVFNSSDPDDTTPMDAHFNRGANVGSYDGVGVVINSGAPLKNIIAGASNDGVSAPGWTSSGYNAAARNTSASRITDYVKSRKDYITIPSLSDTQFTSKSTGIFLVQGNLTLDNSAVLNGKQVIIISTGSITINADIKPTGAAVAIVAPTIYIRETVGEVRGLLVGNSISLVSQGFSGTSKTPLKIVGNLSSGSPIVMSSRVRDDSFRPSFFVVQDSSMITQLLPLISQTKYDWKQLQ
jgi:hypothetical protein